VVNSSESETELTISSEEEEEQHSDTVPDIVTPPPKVQQNNNCRRGPRTRRSLSRTSAAQTREEKKEEERKALEEKWKREDSPPTIPEFTATNTIHAQLLDNSVPLDFLDIFLDDRFYNYLTLQTNLYAAQYLQANPNIPLHSHFKRWKDVSSAEMKQFISLYILTGIVREPEMNQYCSTNPLMKTPFFSCVMPRN